MRAVDRAHFVLPDMPRAYAYVDSALPIGHKQTISAPHMHATALDLLQGHAVPGASVLDVGSGSGYLSAALGKLVGDQGGQVIGVEKHKELADRSIQNIKDASPELLEQQTVKIMPGNVLGSVLDSYGLFDAIHVGAAADEIPQTLVDKLKPGGRMVIPVGPQDSFQDLYCVDKDAAGNVTPFRLMSVAYVPLTRPDERESEE
ncbi:hypothetical protein WJX72_011929 [[Myrmecia] bisecta]|uniref:protein-L-isoaspartate(D-aspartate) O-methyltransferase n=1 Tax=[Myrmecia] bisecta TaxID=41462 RepID=A0AAW1QBF5_9CHLO